MVTPPKESLGISSELLAAARDGDETALAEFSRRLQPGLAALIQQYLPDCPTDDRTRLIAETVNQIGQNLASVRTSVAGYVRSVMLGLMCDQLLVTAKRHDSRALNSLLILLRLKLREDPQLSSQGWGSRVDEDLLQESCLILMEKVESRVDSNPYLYFKQIVINKLRDKDRATQTSRERFQDIESRTDVSSRQEGPERQVEEEFRSEENLESDIEKRDLVNQVHHAAQSLSGFCRDFFKALYLETDEKQWRMAARKKWDMTETALNTRIHRCRHNLQAFLEKMGVIERSGR